MIKISIRNHNIYISKNFTIFVFIRQKSILFYSKFPILNVQPFETFDSLYAHRFEILLREYV